ncbi:MAG: beta-propeller fold lactonase family protein [Verrucomicrobiae bacterium]|nr:beta-propeller fold lactonase family protein [Verrucomicrobiae bacterium]
MKSIDFPPARRPIPPLQGFRLFTALGFLALAAPAQEFVNFEGKQTNPIRLSADGTRLFAVNTPDARVSVFDLTHPATPRLIAEIPVGIEPVSVHPRSNDEVWVVNEVSDSVSVVSVSRGMVVATLRVRDEPMDVVFARGRAFVSVGRSHALAVFDAGTREELDRIPLLGLNPRALAVSPDGSRVYVAFALSGNRTTIIPREEAPDQPGPTRIPDAPPKVALIVDAEDPAWADEIRYTLPDNDVAEIDADSLTVTRYFSRLGTVNLGLGVHPGGGQLWVANTDARNRVFFEPALRGYTHLNRVTRVDLTTGAATPFDLNPDIDYGVMPNLEARATALAQPTSVVFHPSGDHFYVAAFGTDRVARVDTHGTILDRIEVGEVKGATPDPRNKRGPRGLALHPDGSRLYVMNRIANTISVIDTGTRSVVGEFPTGSHDPTPETIRVGRGFLYDARLSGNGTLSCASCHVDGEMDHLAWNLGNPDGELQRLTVFRGVFPTSTHPAHPMKGPMTTQTLRGLKGMEPLHWRGDRASLLDFNPAFDSLMGAEPLGDEDMRAFKDFVETIAFQPNPNRNLDNSLPVSLAGGDPRAGQDFFRNTDFLVPGFGPVRCVSCHAQPTGLALPGFRITQHDGMDIVQPMKIPHLRNLYQRLDFDNTPGAMSLSGFGLEHDGSRAGIAQALSVPRFETIRNDETIIRNLAAFLLAFDTGTPPAVGHDLTLTRENLSSPAVISQWDTLEQQVQSSRIDLIAKSDFGALLFDRATSGSYRSDGEGDPFRSRHWVEERIREGATVTLMGVPVGSGWRMAIDRNLDGIPDGVPPRIPLVVRFRSTGDAIHLSWDAEADRAYAVDSSNSLEPGSWTPLATGIVSQEGAATFSDSLADRGPARFYRIRHD